MRVRRPSDVPGWFGKLPAVGDFAGRRVPHGFKTEWDLWFRSGMAVLRAQDDRLWAEDFARSSTWCFICPAGVTGWPVCGLLAPSRDCVGRAYPLTVLALAPQAEAAALQAHVLRRFLDGAHAAVEAARLQGLGVEGLDQWVSSLPSPFVARGGALNWLVRFAGGASAPAVLEDARTQVWRQVLDGGSERSLWWRPPCFDATGSERPAFELTHAGPLNQALFMRLFQGEIYRDGPSPHCLRSEP